jgi:hypothetical protein
MLRGLPFVNNEGSCHGHSSTTSSLPSGYGGWASYTGAGSSTSWQVRSNSTSVTPFGTPIACTCIGSISCKAGHSGYPKILGWVIRVVGNLGIENCYPIFVAKKHYPKFRVTDNSGLGSGFT